MKSSLTAVMLNIQRKTAYAAASSGAPFSPSFAPSAQSGFFLFEQIGTLLQPKTF